MKRFKLLCIWAFAILLGIAWLLVGVFFPPPLFSAGQYRPTGYEAITVDDTAGGKYLTVAKYYDSTTGKQISDMAIIRVESAQCRYTVDGTTVTSSVGMLVLPMETIVLQSFAEIQGFHIIRAGDVSASIKVTFYKYYEGR